METKSFDDWSKGAIKINSQNQIYVESSLKASEPWASSILKKKLHEVMTIKALQIGRSPVKKFTGSKKCITRVTSTINHISLGNNY